MPPPPPPTPGPKLVHLQKPNLGLADDPFMPPPHPPPGPKLVHLQKPNLGLADDPFDENYLRETGVSSAC